MVFGYTTLSKLVLALTAVAQLYLFFQLRRAVRGTGWPRHWKAGVTGLAGAAMVLLTAMNVFVVTTPIPWVDPPLVAQVVLFYLPMICGVGSVFSALLLGVARGVGAMARLAGRSLKSRAERLDQAPVNPVRRRLLQVGVGGLAAAPFIVCGYGALYASRNFTVREVALPFAIPLRVVQLTDIHAGIFMSRSDIRRCAAQVAALHPDLLVLTGDLISNSPVFLSSCLEELARVPTRYGTFAALGNHEHWFAEWPELQTMFRRSGIPVLRNTHRVLESDNGPFALAGIEDLRAGHPDLQAALAGLDPSIPTILLSHRPAIFPKAAALGIAITLAGHYHGGQVKLRLPSRDIRVIHRRTPYAEGIYRIKNSYLYVSPGIGTTFIPIRLNVPPEITLLVLG